MDIFKKFSNAMNWPFNVSKSKMADKDGDGVPNAIDCNPNNPKKQESFASFAGTSFIKRPDAVTSSFKNRVNTSQAATRSIKKSPPAMTFKKEVWENDTLTEDEIEPELKPKLDVNAKDKTMLPVFNPPRYYPMFNQSKFIRKPNMAKRR